MKKLISLLCAVLILVTSFSQVIITPAAQTLEPAELDRSNAGNPLLGFDENEDILYGGDPSVMVDGDTVYLYVGCDISTDESYCMPDWRCYSSTDMVNWKYESVILRNSDITWAADGLQAWAAQPVKHNGKYYFYYCTEGNYTVGGGKCIGVAVSDSPTGPFVDIGQPLVRNVYETTGSVHSWEDIDPTVWVENVNGVEHRVLGWGNTRFFNAQLNDDMISITDVNNDGIIDIDGGDIKVGKISGLDNHSGCYANNNQSLSCADMGCTSHYFTEAPYYYRQQNDKGEYFGKYYMFFACDWREQMAYATANTYKDFINNNWQFGGVVQEPSATSNTNHMAVFDFKGQTYFVYHTGALPHGSGFRRVACAEPISVNADGSIDYINKTATGLSGTAYTLQDMSGKYIEHKAFANSLNDSFYKIKGKQLQLTADINERCTWVINNSKSTPLNSNIVSIESNNKPGLYISAELVDGVVTPVLSQDIGGTDDEAKAMSFKTYKGVNGGIIFESVKYPCHYLICEDNKLSIVHNASVKQASFIISADSHCAGADIQKTKTLYYVGDVVNDNDIQIIYTKPNGQQLFVDDYTTNVSEFDMSTEGLKKLSVTYTINSISYTDYIQITVVDSNTYNQSGEISYTMPSTTEAVVVNSILEEPESATSVAPISVGTDVNTTAETSIPDGLLVASYNFDTNLNNQLASGDKALYRQTGLKSTYGTAKFANGKNGKAVQLDNYGLKLNKGNLGETYTISMWVKPDGYINANAPIIFIGSDTPEKWLAISGDVRDNVKFWAHGGIYNDWRMLSGFKLTSDKWYNLTISEANGRVSLYVDGFFMGTFDSNKPLDSANADIYLGVNKWDEEFAGAIDDVTVYNTSLTQEQIQSLSSAEFCNELHNKLNTALSKPEILGDNASSDCIKYDLALPDTIDGSNVEWTSSAPEVISANGIVTNPVDKDTVVTLTAKISNGILSATSKINLTVKPLDREKFDLFISEVSDAYSQDLYTEESYSQLDSALALAYNADSYSKVRASAVAIENAVSKLIYKLECINPFSMISLSDNKTTRTLCEDVSVNALNIPDNINDYADIIYYTGDDSVVVFDGGIIKTIGKGKTIVNAVVTSKFNNYSVDYSIAVNVTDDEAVLDVINDITDLPDVTLNDAQIVSSVNAKFNNLSNEQKEQVDFDLTDKLTLINEKLEYLTSNDTVISSQTGHTYTETKVTREPTCKSKGEKLYTCSCGAEKTVDIPVLQHVSETKVTKAKVGTNGSIVTSCKLCKEQLKKEIIYAPKDFKLSSTKYVYDGKAKKPTVTVKDSNGKTIASSNYKVSYKDNKNVGTATVTITFKGNYSGEKKLSFTINPQPTAISKLTAAKKAFTVKWKKQSKQTTGYEIQYSKDKNFKKGNKTVLIKKNSTTSKKITKLTAKKKYYIRIRTYKTVGKTKYYSTWSKSKSIKTK